MAAAATAMIKKIKNALKIDFSSIVKKLQIHKVDCDLKASLTGNEKENHIFEF
jgi:hypothetical protein